MWAAGLAGGMRLGTTSWWPPGVPPAPGLPGVAAAATAGAGDQAPGFEDERSDLPGGVEGEFGHDRDVVSAVGTMLEWPSTSCTVRRSTPAASARLAAPRRRS
jgi:hypothetical protein